MALESDTVPIVNKTATISPSSNNQDSWGGSFGFDYGAAIDSSGSHQ
jgi:hypothetical protein